MTRSTIALFAALLLSAAAASGLAQAQPDREALRERMQNMTPEQKAAMKEKLREKWASMTPEDREAARQRMAERRPDAAKRLSERPSVKAPSPGPIASEPS
ncbi:DUF3106 domain-containing protein [Rubrivivax albus]|uniref:DUF3106 domain-containing protein n=1 Tax=Rubrivivax albus TaxID=2499835 RepID=A0A437JTA7_9BURK|nr:DUF3106 domain-containing protein [Rubrivivax albus]RVT50207.1 DUF3106 domain-containing protein [Rubrivivax albus]